MIRNSCTGDAMHIVTYGMDRYPKAFILATTLAF